jgi:CSLREA domain-containing protein
MAILTVTTTADVVDASDGQLSLREAVAQANATSQFDTVRFAADLDGATLVLTGGELTVTEDMRIDGGLTDDGPDVTIDADRGGRIVDIVGGGTDLKLNDVILERGSGENATGGGAIRLGGGSLSMERSTVQFSEDGWFEGYGGAIFATAGSRISIDRSNFVDNQAWRGGAIYGSGVSLEVKHSQFLDNYGNATGGQFT